jgi:hypothetical protein
MQQSNTLYAVNHKDDGNKHTLLCHIAKATMTMVDCNKGMQVCHATTNQILVPQLGNEQQLQNNNIVGVMIIFLHPTLYHKKL